MPGLAKREVGHFSNPEHFKGKACFQKNPPTFVLKSSKMATANILETAPLSVLPSQNDLPQNVSWEDFEKNYLTREDEFKYEWVRGRVVKTFRPMNQYQDHIVENLQELFFKMLFDGKVTGRLSVEVDSKFLPNAHRRPDLAWFSVEQKAKMSRRENQVPNFVIEIISDHDNADDLLDKLKDYEDAKVEVVWLISPKLKQVRIFSTAGNQTCTGEMVCSAAPVLPQFQISVNQIFELPGKN